MMNEYYMLKQLENRAEIVIYGDITSFPFLESDVSSHSLSKELAQLENVREVDVHINSYGGEVAEGLAIYNALRSCGAKIRTICDGFACSIASVVFMAGDERIMNESSLLMIHNPWTFIEGNAQRLRKEADDLEKISEASIAAYLRSVAIDRKELIEMLDAETWITPDEAIANGFATAKAKADQPKKAAQSIRKSVMDAMKTSGAAGSNWGNRNPALPQKKKNFCELFAGKKGE